MRRVHGIRVKSTPVRKYKTAGLVMRVQTMERALRQSGRGRDFCRLASCTTYCTPRLQRGEEGSVALVAEQVRHVGRRAAAAGAVAREGLGYRPEEAQAAPLLDWADPKLEWVRPRALPRSQGARRRGKGRGFVN